MPGITVTDEQLMQNASRLRGKTLVITGAASGIGKVTALEFARQGANVVIGDVDVTGAQATVNEILKEGGKAIVQKTDVTNWDEQVSLFELAMATYGSVDVVVPNAGINENKGSVDVVLQNGVPVKPNLKTIEVNLIGAMYTSHMGKFYLRKGKQDGDLKALVMIGSMASWAAIPRGPNYSASKHGVLGFMRSMSPEFTRDSMRIGCVHPWFADTPILPTLARAAFAGIPLVPVPRIAACIVAVATDTDWATNGAAWVLPDDGPVYRIEKEAFTEGVYGAINARLQAINAARTRVQKIAKYTSDIFRVFGGFKVVMLVVGLALGARTYRAHGAPPASVDGLKTWLRSLAQR